MHTSINFSDELIACLFFVLRFYLTLWQNPEKTLTARSLSKMVLISLLKQGERIKTGSLQPCSRNKRPRQDWQLPNRQLLPHRQFYLFLAP